MSHGIRDTGHVTSYLPTPCKALQKCSLVLGLGHLLCCQHWHHQSSNGTEPGPLLSLLWISCGLPLNQLPLHCLTQTFSEKQSTACLSHIWIASLSCLTEPWQTQKSINDLVVLWYYTNRLHEPAADRQIRTALIHSFINIDASCLLGVSIVHLSQSPLLSPPLVLLKGLGNVLGDKPSLPL